MDRLDIRILRELMQGEPLLLIWPARARARPALKLVGKKLGVAESTVRSRLEKLSRLVSEGTLLVNPSLLRERHGILAFDVPGFARKQMVIDELKLIEGMFIVLDFVGPGVFAAFFYSDEPSLNKKISLIADISGCGNNKTFSNVLFPKCDQRLSRTDLQIIASRLADMNKSGGEIAQELRISSRTVKRRFAKMAQEGAISPVLSVNVSGLKDCVYCILMVTCKKGDSRAATEAKILSMVDDYLIFYGHFETFTDFDMIVPSLPIGEKIQDRVRTLKDVETARIEFIAGRYEMYEVMLSKVNRQLAVTGTI